MAAVSDAATGLKVKAYTVTGPSSYTTGGIVHDASADFESVKFVDIIINTRGSLPAVQYEIDVDVDRNGNEALGQCVVKLVRGQYNLASMGATSVSSPPSGVTPQSSLFAAGTTTGSSHTHDASHTHGSVVSSTETSAADNAPGALGTGAMVGHTHTWTFPNLSLTTAANTHTHNRAFEYDHNHGFTTVVTDVTLTELASTTNISTTTFTFLVYGFGKR